MNKGKSRALSALAAAALVVGLGGIAAPAQALGTGSRNCAPNILFYGTSTSEYSRTWTQNSSACGTLGARIAYRTYVGSPLYYTAWSYAVGSVQRTSTNIIVAGNHYASSSGITFST